MPIPFVEYFLDIVIIIIIVIVIVIIIILFPNKNLRYKFLLHVPLVSNVFLVLRNLRMDSLLVAGGLC